MAVSEGSKMPKLVATATRAVLIPAGSVSLRGDLSTPPTPRGVVVFAHGSGSSRMSPRNRRVARWLNRAGLTTLLFDLLTGQEESDRGNVFDIQLLAGRLSLATAWLRAESSDQPAVGYFGASTGAAAALWAAAESGTEIRAVVSRGGRPDLAGSRLAGVTAPTLLVVGERDGLVVGLNERARAKLRCPSDLVVVPGAGHLFEEPGAIDVVARLAADWFVRHLPGEASP
jgi:putative phosphoribosyl transferase